MTYDHHQRPAMTSPTFSTISQTHVTHLQTLFLTSQYRSCEASASGFSCLTAQHQHLQAHITGNETYKFSSAWTAACGCLSPITQPDRPAVCTVEGQSGFQPLSLFPMLQCKRCGTVTDDCCCCMTVTCKASIAQSRIQCGICLVQTVDVNAASGGTQCS